MKGLVSLELRGAFFIDFFPLVQAPAISVAKNFSGYDRLLDGGPLRMESDEFGSCFAQQNLLLTDAMLTNFVVMGFFCLLQKSHAWAWTHGPFLSRIDNGSLITSVCS